MGVVLCFALLTLFSYSQTPPTPPLSKERIIRLLKGDVSPKRVAELARQRGIDFEITAEIERELREAGAADALLTVLREITSKPPAAVPNPLQQGPPAVGEARENPKDKLRYVWIPPGNFMMGCSPGDLECFEDEKPPHEVIITHGFWIGQTEVTQAAYGTVMQTNARHFKASDRPVEQVSWDEAKAYCEAVGMRLPTEAEWEYAARAGSTEARYRAIDRAAWYADNSQYRTHPVATKASNAWGLYDTLGNVWEWVEDWYDSAYYKQNVSTDPPGPNASSDYGRVVRGAPGTLMHSTSASRTVAGTRLRTWESA